MTTTDTIRDTLLVLLGCVLLAGLLFGCSDTGGPAAPVAPTAVADSFGPPAAGRATPASFDAASSLRHDVNEGFNAYDFTATYDGSMLTLVLVEDEMRSMREASKPHRNRTITVGICPSEPRRISQACGDPIWQGSMRLADSLTLPSIPLAACNGWIVVNADEMFDDRYDGWRNAPCPRPDSEPVGSDGTGPGWSDYSQFECGKDGDIGDPRRNEKCAEPEREQEQAPPPPPSRFPLTYVAEWGYRVGPVLSTCVYPGGTAGSFCFDADDSWQPLLRRNLFENDPPLHPAGPVFGPGGASPHHDETEERQRAVGRYNGAPVARWTTEQERRQTATAYAGQIASLVCEAEGGVFLQGSVEVFPAVNPVRLPGAVDGWGYSANRAQTGFNYGARPVYQWRATCVEPQPEP